MKSKIVLLFLCLAFFALHAQSQGSGETPCEKPDYKGLKPAEVKEKAKAYEECLRSASAAKKEKEKAEKDRQSAEKEKQEKEKRERQNQQRQEEEKRKEQERAAEKQKREERESAQREACY
jgi:cell division protein FtsN